MSKEGRAKGVIIAVIIWLFIAGIAAVSYKFVVKPFFSERLETKTGSESQYAHTVSLAVDSFSGYCVLRSEAMRDLLKSEKIRLDIIDDGADYWDRIKKLKQGKIQMAVFTIDSFLAAGAELGEYPGSIVLVLDETKGADGIVAYKDGLESIQDLDHPDAKMMLTPDSPSEFMARTVLAHFSLPSLPDNWMEKEDGAEGVYKKFRVADTTKKRAYILWEPYLTMAAEATGAHVLLDSSNLKGYIVDVLVANREFLSEEPDAAATVVESYLRAAHSYRSRDNAMTELVLKDAKQLGTKLTRAQAEKLVGGIDWKNTLENYGHFGIDAGMDTSAVQHLEDIIPNIADVLLKTGKLTADPVGNAAHTLFYDRILRELAANNFDPARKMDLLQGVATSESGLGTIDSGIELPALSDAQWDSLAPLGKMRIKNIAFARGTARINIQSQRELEALAKRLESLPQYYLLVQGHARAEGDPEANRRLAQERAEAACQALLDHGLHPNRVKPKATEPSKQNGGAQSVSFVVGRPPY